MVKTRQATVLILMVGTKEQLPKIMFGFISELMMEQEELCLVF